MRISFQCCFDLGRTLGVTDTVFDPLREHFLRYSAYFTRYSAVTVTFPACGKSAGVSNQLGSGVRIDIPSDHPLTTEWRRKAINVEEQRPDWEDNPPRQRVLTLLEQLQPSQFFANVFAVGTVFLRIDFAFDPNDEEHLLAFYNAYEFAGYDSSISERLKNIVEEVIDFTLIRRHSYSRDLLDRGPPETGLIPSFTLIVESDPLPRTQEQVDAHRFNEAQTTPQVLETEAEMQLKNSKLRLRLQTYDVEPPVQINFYYYGTLYLGYAVHFIELRKAWSPTRKSREFERIWHSLEVAQVYLATCEIVETLLMKNANRVVDKGGFGKTDNARQFEQLRLLALAISGITRFESTTQTGEDLKLFKEFERHTNLSIKRKAIVSASEILYAAAEAEVERKQASRDHRLAWLLAVVSALTLCSVVTDILGAINWTDWGADGIVGSRPMQRDLIVLVLVFVLVTLMLLVDRIAARASERHLSQQRRKM